MVICKLLIRKKICYFGIETAVSNYYYSCSPFTLMLMCVEYAIVMPHVQKHVVFDYAINLGFLFPGISLSILVTFFAK